MMTRKEYLDKLNEDFRLGRFSEDEYQTRLAIACHDADSDIAGLVTGYEDHMSTLDEIIEEATSKACAKLKAHLETYQVLSVRKEH